MNAHAPNDAWGWIWGLGYRAIIPIKPNDKAPGVLTEDGWVNLKTWQRLYPSEADVDRYRNMGAGIGIRCEKGLLAIDADTMNAELSVAVETEITARLGTLPQRIGQAPKKLFLLRTTPDYFHPKILFDGGQIDIRTYGQFVASGVHPKTGTNYQWVRALPPAEELPFVAPSDLNALWATLRDLLPQGRFAGSTGLTIAVDPETLRGSVARVRRALELVPNDYADRDTYINVLTAVRGALPDDLEDAWDLVWPWCESWCGPNGEGNDRDVVRRDFDSLKPIRLGIGYLEALANKRSDGLLLAERNHEAVAPSEAPPVAAAWSQPATVFVGKAVPAQRWLAAEMVPARTVTLLYGDGGTGKSLVSLQLAFGVAASGKWLGLDVARGPALFVTAEDEPEEVHRRIAAVTNGSGLTLDDLGALHWRSLSGQDAVLAAPNSKNLMEPTALFAALRAEIARLRPVLLVLDTLADLFGGDEIKRIHARQFIQLLQGLIVALPWDMSIVLLAHPSVAGMNSGTGTSGSTAWSNSVRSRLYLERVFAKPRHKEDREKIEVDPDVRVLSTKKANRTKQGGEIKVRWSAGRFIEHVAVAGSNDAEADATDELVFLEIFDKMTRAGQNLNTSVNASNYAPRLFIGDASGFQVGQRGLEGAMARLLLRGILAVENTGSPSRPRFKLIRRQNDLFG